MEIQPSTPSVSSVDPSIAQEDQVLHEAVAHKPIAQSHTPENADGVVVISLDGRAKSESDRADDDSDEDRSSDEESDAGVEGDEDTPKSKTEDGMKCKLKQLYKEDINRHDWWSDTKPYGHESDKTRYALIVRNVFNDDADASRRTRIHSVVIQSPLLKAILRKILDGYPGLALTTDRLTFSSPFQPLVHHWDTIKDAAEKEENEQARRHLKLLITSLETELSEDLEAVRHFNEHKVIRFKHLWAIFHPEELVYSKQGKAECLFKLKRTEYIKSNGVTYLLLHSHFVEWDGDRFGKANKVLAIPEFRESAPFSDLSSYPFRCHPHQDELMKKLEARGRRFHELSGFSYKAYTGVGIDETDPRDIKAFHVDGRIVVDTSSYLQFNANEKVNLTSLVDTTATVELNAQEQYDPYGGTYFRSGDIYGQPMLNWQEVQEAIKTNDKSGAKPKQELSVDELLLCSHMLRGFSLKMKNWLKFEVDLVQEIEWNEDAFETLVLPGDYKKLLLAFSESQRASSGTGVFDDVIKGKGKGMVILLSGPPGVGKTLTAESVAEKMRVPLYSISAGELGLSAGSVEHKLRQVFDLTKNWNAVVLLDEADIFLEKRRMDDLVRNELVSIFLQNLEYFEGTLFLTTNRVETFDPAFESRIHISIAYPDLNHDSRRQVWHNFIQRIPSEKRNITENDLDYFSGLTLNGRQIKNAVKAAGLLAYQDGQKLSIDHMKTVLNIMRASLGITGK